MRSIEREELSLYAAMRDRLFRGEKGDCDARNPFLPKSLFNRVYYTVFETLWFLLGTYYVGSDFVGNEFFFNVYLLFKDLFSLQNKRM